MVSERSERPLQPTVQTDQQKQETISHYKRRDRGYSPIKKVLAERSQKTQSFLWPVSAVWPIIKAAECSRYRISDRRRPFLAAAEMALLRSIDTGPLRWIAANHRSESAVSIFVVSCVNKRRRSSAGLLKHGSKEQA